MGRGLVCILYGILVYPDTASYLAIAPVHS
jgi:hypothetical protein